uniref:RecA family profile 1 domain-containing protein n=1 Tax=Rhodosorus marinus TaxID=101924 RepID=A0A7S2ZZ69_9RHOD|mmetsp:Transcript_3712/g.16295  ORF Transcript_3712/g.16295 Transcript_3712/m.16295 type:complete len:304 (+) Transcript_3712:606-1517(+)
MDPRLTQVARELMSELGREGAIQLLITEDDGLVKKEIEKVCLGLSTGPQFRGHVLLALRTELFEDQVVLRSASELYRDREVLKTGIRSLDSLVGGDGIGIGEDGQLIEFTGRAGAGKSQLCMQLALMSGAPRDFGGLENGCVYINTEGNFPTSRMLEIETGLREKLQLQPDHQESSFSDKVIVERCRSADSLISLCSYRLPWLLEQSGARVVIIDSVAAPLRFNNDRSARSGSARDSLLFQLAKALRTVARKFKALVLLTNQVTDVFIEAHEERAGAIRLRGSLRPFVSFLTRSAKIIQTRSN